MRDRSEAAQGWIRGRFKTDFVPPGIPPVTTLLGAFGSVFRTFRPLFRSHDRKM
jgi:hypothetical protein